MDLRYWKPQVMAPQREVRSNKIDRARSTPSSAVDKRTLDTRIVTFGQKCQRFCPLFWSRETLNHFMSYLFSITSAFLTFSMFSLHFPGNKVTFPEFGRWRQKYISRFVAILLNILSNCKLKVSMKEINFPRISQKKPRKIKCNRPDSKFNTYIGMTCFVAS